MSRPRILWISQNPFDGYSFAQQSLVVLQQLAQRGYEIHYLGGGYSGPITDFDSFRLYPLQVGSSVFGDSEIIMDYCREIHPDLVVALATLGGIGFLTDSEPFLKEWPWILWQPMESATPHYLLQAGEKKVPYYVSVAQFEYEIKRKEGSNFIGVIPHATDSKVFFPESDERKQLLRKRFSIPENAFVIGSVMNPEKRKQPFRLIDAFKRFASQYPDAHLLLLVDSSLKQKDRYKQYFDIPYYVEYFCEECKERIHLVNRLSSRPLSTSGMKDFYNAMDVFALSTSGEGWGLPFVEAMACEVPPIATDCSSIPEVLGEDCGWKVKVKEWVWGLGSSYLPGALVDIDDMAAQFEDAYLHPEKRKRLGSNGRQKAIRLYSPEIIADKWESILQRAFEESREKYPHLWRKGKPNSRLKPKSPARLSRWLERKLYSDELWREYLIFTKQETDDTKILFRRGVAQEKLRRHKLAIAEFEKVLKVNPEHKGAHAKIRKLQKLRKV